MKTYETISKCKICGSAELTDIIRFEPQHLSATFVEDNSKVEISKIKVPMTLTLCDPTKNKDGCGLLQMKEEVHHDLLYRQYFYRSSTSMTMRMDLQEVVKDVMGRTPLGSGDIIVDIGANDCTMIGFYPSTYRRVGYEPARNIDWSHVDRSISIINNYFEAKSFIEKFGNEKARAVTCCAMFYDLSDPERFVRDVKQILADDGVWCIQLSYLPLTLQNMNFYDICHEHLAYYSLDTLEQLMKRNNMMVIDASANTVNGGSLRAFVVHQSNVGALTEEGRNRLEALREKERKMDLKNPQTYQRFEREIHDLSMKVRGYIEEKIRKGGKVFGLGASTKGNVLLQLFGIGKNMLPKISERNPEKVGLRTLGTDIELISEEEARRLKPASMLVLPWYFKDEIVKREREYLDAEGTLLFPMPYAHVVTREGEIRL